MREGDRTLVPAWAEWSRRRLTLLVAVALVLGSTAVVLGEAAPAEAAVLPYCRSTDGSGSSLETAVAKSGYFEQNAIRVEPVFARRLYIDPSRTYDAGYIGYRITNVGDSDRSDVWLEVTGLTGDGTAVTLVSPSESQQFVGTLAKRSGTTNDRRHHPVSRYLLVRARAETTDVVWHEVRVWTGRPGTTGAVARAACRTSIDGVQRSISANANKVTAITVDGAPTVGRTITVTVTGAPGNVGAGNSIDGSVIALTPATSSAWPAGAVRLERVRLQVDGVRQPSLPACISGDPHSLSLPTSANNVGHGVLTANNGSNRSAIYTDTLIVRGFSACTTVKATYTATYTFRVLSSTGRTPVIRPHANISSGTQIKYTGSLPATQTPLPLDDAVVDATAVKQYVDVAASNDTHVDVRYRVVASISTAPASGTTTQMRFDAIEDVLTPVGALQSATVTDALGTRPIATTDVVRTERVVGSVTEVVHRFIGPFEATRTATDRTDVTLTYVLRLARPASGSTEFRNYAWALSGEQVIGTGVVVTGIKVEVPDDGAPGPGQPDTRAPDKRTQRITFDPLGPFGAGTSTTISATTDSGLPVTFTVTVGGERCAVSLFDGVWTLQALASGTCTVTATADGDAVYAAASPVARDIVVLAGQFITSSDASFAGGVSTTDITLTATSKLPVGLRSLDTDVCTTSGTPTSYDASTGATIHAVAKGTAAGACRLVATQGGDGTTWGPAPDLEIMIGVGQPQSLTFSAPASGTEVTLTTSGISFVPQTADVVGTTDANATLSGTKRLPLQFRTLTPAVCRVTQPTSPADGELLSGLNTTTGSTTWTYTLIAPGTCTLAADQDGLDDDGNPSAFAPTGPITRSITVRSAATTPQHLFLSARATLVYGDVETFLVTASSRQLDDPASTLTGLSVLLAGTTGVCTVGTAQTAEGVTTATVRVTAGGVCTIRAEQAGDSTYMAATPITTDVIVTARTVGIAGLTEVDRVYDGTTTVALTGTPTLSGVVPGDGPVDVGLAGTATASLTSPSAGEERTATVSGLTLSGAKAADSYVLTAMTLAVTIAQRPVDIDGLNAAERAYDGTRTVAVSGSPSPRAALDSTPGRGRVGSDDLTVTGTPTASLVEPDAGTFNVTVAGLSLGGAAAANYSLTAPSLPVTITARSITITAQDRSVKTGGTPLCTAAGAGLADGDSLQSVTCTYLRLDGSERDPANDDPGDESRRTARIVASEPTFVRDEETVEASNYAVTFVEGLLKIVGKAVPVLSYGINGRDRTFVYGTPLAGLLDVDPQDDGGLAVAGSIANEREGTSVDDATVLDVGIHEITVEFTPTDTANFETITETRTFTVTRRPVAVTGVTATSRVFDGTTVIAVSAAGAALEAQAGARGVLAVDEADAVLGGTPAGSVATPDVGVGRDVSVTGLQVTGSRAGNYLLEAPTGVAAAITARPLSIVTSDVTIAPGDTLTCSVSASLGDLVGLVGSDAIDSAVCATSAIGGGAADLETEGTANITASSAVLNPGKLSNYDITFVAGTVTIERLEPVVTASEIEIMYGQTLAGRLGHGWSAVSPSGGAVSGTLSQKLDGSPVDEDGVLPATGSYTLQLSFAPGDSKRYRSATTERVVKVAKRPVTVTPVTRFKLVGEDDPSFDATRSGLLPGDADIPLDAPIAVGRAPGLGQDGQTVGQYVLRSSGGGHANYAFTHADGILYIGSVTADIPEEDELDRDEPITCACEGLVEGMEVSVELFSDPVLLGTETVTSDGTCPLLAALRIPTDFPPGDHSLVITIRDGGLGVLDDPIVLRSEVTISGAPTVTTGRSDDDGPGGPEDSAAGTGPDPISVPGPSLLSGPASSPAAGGVRPAPPGVPSGPALPAGPGTMPVGPAERGGACSAIVAESRASTTVGLEVLAQERFPGYVPGSRICIRVIGARSTARFVLTGVDLVDVNVTARVLARSARSQAADFARITDIRPLASMPNGAVPTWTSVQREDADAQFRASRLPQPTMLADLDLSGFTQWVMVSGEVSGYLPGSALHLAVTSESVVLASVVVGRDGTATISGALPVGLLGIGEHRLRFVGTRVFDGVSADGNGEFQLPAEVLEQIERFDRGTDATVILAGVDGDGGSHVSLRTVRLDPVAPWWTLLVVLAVGALGLRARRRGRLEATWRKGVMSGAFLVAAVPAVVLGWLATTTVVAVVGGVVALLLAAAVPIVRPRTDDPAAMDDLDDQDLVDLEL
jgi:hypothetical protein